MGDWSNNLEYEQREYYGHFYDTDEDVHEEEETDDLISKQKVLNTLDFADNALDEERTVENFKAILTECIKVLPSVQPEPISEEYAKAVRNWLVNYQVKCAELQGRYTPYQVLGWIVSDWGKENEIW